MEPGQPTGARLSAGEARRSVPPGRPAATAVGVSDLAQSMHGGTINNRIFDAASLRLGDMAN
jgi:hypothetical protein